MLKNIKEGCVSFLSSDCVQQDETIFSRRLCINFRKFNWMKNLLFSPAGVKLEYKDVLLTRVGIIVNFSSGVTY